MAALTYIVDTDHFTYEILHFRDDWMKESLLRNIQVELIWKEKRTNGDILSSTEKILLDALKEGVVVAVLGRNNDRLQIVDESELEMLQCTGRGDLQ